MGATNHTTRGLSQFVDNDKPTWRGDYNSDMQKIDKKFDAVGYDPMDYGAVGDGVADDTIHIQAAIDAAHAAGGGKVVLYKKYGWTGDLIHRGGVVVEGNSGSSRFPVIDDHIDRGLIALSSTARYRYGYWATSNSLDDNPGELRNLIINGNNVGGATQLLLMECVNGAINTCQIINSVNIAVEFGRSQNSTIDKCFIGLSAGSAIDVYANPGQGAGNIKVSNTYLATSRYLLTADTDPANFEPHDILFTNCLFENYTAGNDLVDLKAGAFQFTGCVFTYSLTGAVGPPNNCLILIRQPTILFIPTYAMFNNCYFNGGLITGGAVASAHAIRVKTDAGGVGNTVKFTGNQAVGHVQYLLGIDAGAPLVSMHGTITKTTSNPGYWQTINAGSLANLRNELALPQRFIMPSDASIGSPIQIRKDTDTADRYRIDSDGTMRWFDGADGSNVRGAMYWDSTTGMMVHGGQLQIANALVLRPASIVITLVNQAVTLSGARTAAPLAILAFAGIGASAVITANEDGQIGSQIQIMILGLSANSITWPSNIKFLAAPPQPLDATTSFVTIVWDGATWVELERTHTVDQFKNDRITTGQETFPRETATALAASTATQIMRISYFTAYKSQTITQLKSYTGTTAAAATPTLCRMGLYTVAANGDLTLVAATANDTTLWSVATVAYARAIVGPASYDIKRGVQYAFAVLCVTAAAAPTFVGQIMNAAMAISAPRLVGQLSAQADLPATIAAGLVTSNGNRVYGELI